MLTVAPNPIFSQEFPSSLEAMPEVLRRALTVLADRRWIAAGHEFAARLCLEEAMVNAVTHGNKCDRARRVRVEMTEEDDLCHISIFDEGQGFDPERVPPPDTVHTGGRGLCLIKHYMERVRFDDTGNRLEMWLKRCCTQPAGGQSA